MQYRIIVGTDVRVCKVIPPCACGRFDNIIEAIEYVLGHDPSADVYCNVYVRDVMDLVRKRMGI